MWRTIVAKAKAVVNVVTTPKPARTPRVKPPVAVTKSLDEIEVTNIRNQAFKEAAELIEKENRARITQLMGSNPVAHKAYQYGKTDSATAIRTLIK